MFDSSEWVPQRERRHFRAWRPNRRAGAADPADRTRRSGLVTLVGAGPGGHDLITLRGARALGVADVVIYDRLADPLLLDLAPAGAELIGVGKGKGYGPTQDEICAVMIDRAAAGRRVVRLKGGDPFVFGRGLEEVEAMEAAGIDTCVVPGISSALGAPALAGISLTDRRGAASFTVLTGHRCTADDHDWEALARSGSILVVLMAATTADQVACRLVEAGFDPTVPVDFIHAAGTDQQQQASSTVGHVAQDGCPFGAPTVMVIGQTAPDTAVGCADLDARTRPHRRVLVA